MNAARHIQRLSPAAPLRASGLRSGPYTAPAQYRLLSARATYLENSEFRTSSASATRQRQPLLRSTIPSSAVRLERISQSNARAFHVSTRLRQQRAEEKDSKARQETKEGQQSDESGTREESKEEKQKEGDEKTEGSKEKKDDLPPPPPHGDKTPWQVFLDTMQSEFKQSKEWNESTKALAAGANQFVESESVRKARQAYEATSGAVSSTAANVVKTTAGAIGKGASWTWETPVMKGVRKGANKTGEALDKATKPIRETEAFKNVKNVIDDGSSSRYGGWVDKEERRKRREMLEQERKKLGLHNQVFEEDPK